MKLFSILFASFVSACVSVHQSNDSIPISYDEIIKHHDMYEKSLLGDGIWTMWDERRHTFPREAVFSGYRPEGPIFVMRADHTLPSGEYVGKHLGIYMPLAAEAYIVYNNKEYRKSHFELLLHEKSVWADKDDSRPPIPGPGRNICRMKFHGWVWGAGLVDGDTCLTPWRDSVFKSTDYHVLRKSC